MENPAWFSSSARWCGGDPGVVKQLRELVWGQPIGREGHGVAAIAVCRTAVLTGAYVAGEEEMSAGRQGAVELGEHDRQKLRRCVVGGVVRQDAAERVVVDL